MPEAEAEPDCCFTCAARTLLSPDNDPAAGLHLPAHQRADLHEPGVSEEAPRMTPDNYSKDIRILEALEARWRKGKFITQIDTQWLLEKAREAIEAQHRVKP
jgi:hypothetical protein